jgi:hypothetical protein
LANEEHQDVEGHNSKDRECGIAMSKHDDFQHSWKHREVKHYVIHIKVPCLSNIIDKEWFTSILSNYQSDHVSLVNAHIGNLIMHSFERSIEGDNLLNSNNMNSECIDQCTVKNRKVDSSNILAFKLSPSL